MNSLDASEPSYTLMITPALGIPRAELQFRTSRSGGPGGQHVNKVETKVELLYDLANSPALTEEYRAQLQQALTPWLDNAGVMHIVSDRFRSQYKNREDAIQRFVALLQHALRPRKTRKATRTPRAVREARLEAKQHRSRIKHLRQKGGGEE